MAGGGGWWEGAVEGISVEWWGGQIGRGGWLVGWGRVGGRLGGGGLVGGWGVFGAHVCHVYSEKHFLQRSLGSHSHQRAREIIHKSTFSSAFSGSHSHQRAREIIQQSTFTSAFSGSHSHQRGLVRFLLMALSPAP